MYFNDFESFKQAQDSAKSFMLQVDYVDGTSVSSSAFPSESLPQVMADLQSVEELKTMLILWNRSNNSTMSFIPYEQIKTIRVVFGPIK